MISRGRLVVMDNVHSTTLITALLLIFISQQNSRSVQIQSFHQLCRKFDWVGDPLITQLPPSSPFSKCVSISPSPVQNSDIVYVTVSATNLRACTDFRIETIVLTLVTLPHPSSSLDKGIPTGVWSKIPTETNGSTLPSQFPTAYLNNSRYLSTVECFKTAEEENEDPFYRSTDAATNALVYQGQLSPGESFAAKVKVNISIKHHPLPVQLKAEILTRKGAGGILKYWINEGNTRQFTLDLGKITVKPLAHLAGQSISLDSSYYSDNATLRASRQAVPSRKTYMCSCVDPRRRVGTQIKHDADADITELPDPNDPLDDCFHLQTVQCPTSHTEEKLGAIFMQKPCAQSPTVRLVDVSFVALNQKGFPYGELEVNILTKPCIPTDILNFQPVIHNLDAVSYPCPNFQKTDTLYQKDPTWLSVNADFTVAAGESPRVIQVMLKEKIKQGNAAVFANKIQIIAEFGVELTAGGNQEIRRIMANGKNLLFTNANEINWATSTNLTNPIPPHADYLAEAGGLACAAPQECTTCVARDPYIFFCRQVEVNDPQTRSNAIEPCLKTIFKEPAAGSTNYFVSLELDKSVAGCAGLKILQNTFMVLEREDKKAKTAVSGFFAPVQDTEIDNCKDAGSTAGALQQALKYSIEYCGQKGDNASYHNYVELGDNTLVCAKWTFKTASSAAKFLEIQAGTTIYYTDGTNVFNHVYRIPSIYRISGPSVTPRTVELVVSKPNARADILWESPPPTLTSQPILTIPRFRKSHMCDCLSTRRYAAPIVVPQVATDDIPELPTPGDILNDCFELKMTYCPYSKTNEKLGALFIQKPCPEEVTTVDISFIALNEMGYAYGELQVHTLVRPCYQDVSGQDGVTLVLPVVNDLLPVSYECTDQVPGTNLYPKKPSWLSVEAMFEVDPLQPKGRVVQVMFKEKIMQTGGPSAIQIVAEFSYRLQGGAVGIRRIKSDTRTLAFTAKGDLDWAGTTTSPNPIPVPFNHLTERVEAGKGLECTKLAQECAGCKSEDKFLLCRQLVAEKNNVAADPAIEPCLTTAFNYDAASGSYFASVELNRAGGNNCGNYVVKQTVLIVLERTTQNVKFSGTWEANSPADFVDGKCKSQNSQATALKPTLKYSLDKCDPKRATFKEGDMYHDYKELGDQMVCGKWKPGTSGEVFEIQAGVMVYYTDGTNEYTHKLRIPTIYEITPGTPAATVEKIVQDPNKRTDIFWKKAPSELSNEALGLLVQRPSFMCECVVPRRENGSASNPPLPLEILEPLPANLMQCFDFRLADCPDSHTSELLGAVFVLQSGCPTGVKLVDLSVLAVNQLGFPYGKLEVNTKIKMCFGGKNTNALDVFTVKPVLHDLDVVSYDCTQFPPNDPSTLYASTPSWISINANVENEQNPFQNYQGTVFQFVLTDKVKTSSGAQTVPTSLQFIAEFGVEENGNDYRMYRMRTEQRNLGFAADGRVDFGLSPNVAGDIPLSSDYIDTNQVDCHNPKPNPISQLGPSKPFICQCQNKCNNNQCGAPDPDIENCFNVVVNLQAGSNPPQFFMSFRKEAGNNCPLPDIIIHDVIFTALQRPVGQVESDVGGQWSTVDDASYSTVGECIDQQQAGLKPKHSSRFSFRECMAKGGATTYPNGLYWLGRKLETPEQIVCAKLTFAPPTSEFEVETAFKVIYSLAAGGPLKSYEAMHPKIFKVDSTKTELIYDKENSRVILLGFNEFDPTCHDGPAERPSQMCDCYNPQSEGGPAFPLPIKELEASGLEGCFQLTMVDCPDSHTDERLGVLFTQNGEGCQRMELETFDLSIVAVNELGYPYGQLEVAKTSTECLAVAGAGNLILNHRPIMNKLYDKLVDCTLYMPERSKYGTKTTSFLNIKLNIKSGPGGTQPAPGPHAVQMILKEAVESASNPRPTHLQFIAEFTVRETANSGVEAYRIVSEHQRLAFAGGKVSLAASTAEADPRIELHPDYVDTEDLSKPCDDQKGSAPAPTPPPDKWTTCNCFEWEEDSSKSTPAPAQQVDLLLRCVEINFIYATAIAATPTFYLSIAKRPQAQPPQPECDPLQIEQFVLTALRRDGQGLVQTLGKTEGKWDRADLNTDYVLQRCYPAGVTANQYFPQKSGTQSVKPCAGDTTPPYTALYFYYRFLKKNGDVHCAKLELTSPPNMELQILYKIHFYLTSNTATKWQYVSRHPLMYNVRGNVVQPITNQAVLNNRMDLLHFEDPIQVPNPPCIITPFVPSSDICDCTSKRHLGFDQIPDESLVEDIVATVPPAPAGIPLDCFDFRMTACTIAGTTFDTVGAVLIIRASNSTPPCAEDMLVEDAAFQALNEDGFPVGEPKFGEFLRVCFQPADLKNYLLKNANFARPKGGQCTWRKKENGAAFGPEFMYGNRVPSWVQVGINADVPKLEKPVAVQIYLDRPPAGTSHTKIQFITEMVIQRRTDGTRRIYRLKTPVYDIAPPNLEYNPTTLVQSNPNVEIERNDEYYETDESNRRCHNTPPPTYSKIPYEIQQCSCFEWTDGGNPIGTKLDSTSDTYTNTFSNCVNYDWAVYTETGGPEDGFYFYLTVWTRNETQEPECGNFQVVGVTLTPLIRITTDENTLEQEGFPFGKWIRTTVPAMNITAWNATIRDFRLGRGFHCKINPEYSGKLRRLPLKHNDYTRKCTKSLLNSGVPPTPAGEQNLLLFYYPLMNQSDGGNAFCGGIKIANERANNNDLDRFEFQISAYYFMEFANAKYYAIKRTALFEYFEKATVTTGPPQPGSTQIIFEGKVFEIADALQEPTNCEVDICMYDG